MALPLSFPHCPNTLTHRLHICFASVGAILVTASFMFQGSCARLFSECVLSRRN